MRVIPNSRRIVDAKNVERRLIYEYVASLRYDTRYRTDGVANRRMAGHDQLSAQAARHFRIEGARRSTDGGYSFKKGTHNGSHSVRSARRGTRRRPVDRPDPRRRPDAPAPHAAAPAPGFTGATTPKPDDQVNQLLDLYTRCLSVVEGKKA